ncbi:MAG: LysM peptidoglycan-binding domain-containing protein [Prevotella sp.]|jgi:membrane-bound lytic murein transglycosylase D|nr:LysM peptidoglycan-binding domain-containing protein [Prevotella sp.]
MLKKLIFTGLLFGFTTIVSAQSQESMKPIEELPEDFQQNYDLVLAKRDYSASDLNQFNTSGGTVTFPDSVYINRLHTLPTEMELAYNQAVKSMIERYAGSLGRQVSYMLGEAQYYFPIFEDVLDREGLPLELKYLPIIESALRPVARSRAGASGLWQFMASTGKMYGLEVNTLVDERYDTYKATEAAVKYLKFLYNRYNDWNLVIAAYNCGEGRVDKAINRSGGQKDFWVIYPHLPKETRNYVPIFIAATYIMNYFQEHNITPSECQMPFSMDTLAINKTVHFQQISDVLNVSIEDIRKYNPQYRKDVIPGDFKTYTLTLPGANLASFISNEDAVYAHKRNELLTHRKIAGVNVVSGAPLGSTTLTYRVKRGDTLAEVAAEYGVTSNQIKQWNNLSSNTLTVGRHLKIYKQEASSNDPEVLLTSAVGEDTANVVSVSGLTKTVLVPKTTVSYYKIKSGDNWTKIAKSTKTTVSQLKEWNNVKTLIAGKNLKIEKTEYVEVQEPIKLQEPQLATVFIDPDYCASLIDSYLRKLERDESTLPLIRIASTDSKEDEQIRRSSSDDARMIYHKVRIGETITQIATRYNVSKNDIVTWNKLTGSIAKVGQRLLILLPENDKDNTVDNGEQPSNNNIIYSAGK